MDFSDMKPAGLEIKVLGTGCAKCKKLAQHTEAAVQELGIEADVIKVEDLVEIMKFGVMTTPALVVDGKVVTKGSVPSVADIKTILSK